MDQIPYTQQSFAKDDDQALLDCLEKSWITRGPKVSAFEKAVASYCEVPYAVLFNSGTSALAAASYAGNIQPNDSIVSSPNTFVGTLSAALKYTSHLQLLDLDLETGGANFSLLKTNKNQRMCLFPVLFSGIAQRVLKPSKNALLIEDACQAFGSRYLSGERVGSCPHSDMTVFSFHPAKTLCMGEGGMVTTRDVALYKRLLLYRNNGIVKDPSADPWVYDIVDLTSNCNVTEFQAALGLSQLKKVESFLNTRRALVQKYRELLKDVEGIELLTPKYDEFSAHNLFPLLIDFERFKVTRKEVMLKLKAAGISTQVHFIPLYRHSYFQKNFKFHVSDFPHTESYYQRALSLPMYSHLKEEQVESICEKLCEILKTQLAVSHK